MSAVEKKCAGCGNEFRGRANAMCCSASCRQRVRRRDGRKCDTKRDKGVTVPPAGGAHCAAAVAVLEALDRELAENAEQLGQQLMWSAAEELIRDLVADAIDRREVLRSSWLAADDDKVRVKISTELRLLEQEIEKLLRRVKTDLPVPKSLRSQKAARAAHSRWDHAAD